MNILLVNDDGIAAEGLRVLAEALGRRGHNLLIIAPSRERSASSHAATFERSLYLEPAAFPVAGVTAYALSGKPADCVKFGVNYFTDFKAELVISGINRGANIGTDIVYSGTAGAAEEGALLGVRSIAVSAGNKANPDYGTAADFIADNLDKLTAPDAGTYFNVNVPVCGRGNIKGVKVIKHGAHRYNDRYISETDKNGKPYFVLTGEASERDDKNEPSDVKYYRQGYITVTPLCFNRTDYDVLQTAKNKEWKI